MFKPCRENGFTYVRLWDESARQRSPGMRAAAVKSGEKAVHFPACRRSPSVATEHPIDISSFANDANLWNEKTFQPGCGFWRAYRSHPERRGRRYAGRPSGQHHDPRPPAGRQRRLLSIEHTLVTTGAPPAISASFPWAIGAPAWEKQLAGGVDIRDYNAGAYANSIDERFTRNAFDNGRGQRMDIITVALPGEFARQPLETITLADSGRWQFNAGLSGRSPSGGAANPPRERSRTGRGDPVSDWRTRFERLSAGEREEEIKKSAWRAGRPVQKARKRPEILCLLCAGGAHLCLPYLVVCKAAHWLE